MGSGYNGSNSLNRGRLWAFSVVLVLLLLLVQELLFRFVFPIPEIANFNRIDYSMMVAGVDNVDLQPLENSSYSWASDPDGAEFVHHLNLYGFRDHDWPVDSDKTRVMFLGDSFVEGFMAADDQTISRGFEEAARADAETGSSVETINLGTGASGIANYLELISDAVPIFNPDTVVMVLYANDFPAPDDLDAHLRTAKTPLRSSHYLPRAWRVISQLIKHQPVATRWHKKPFMFLPSQDSSRSPLSDPAFTNNVSEYVDSDILASMRTGRFNPFVINEYSNYEHYLKMPVDIVEVIERTKEQVEKLGSQLMIVHIPYRSQVSDYYLQFTRKFDKNKNESSLTSAAYQIHADYLQALCLQQGIAYLDMTAILRQFEDKGEHVYWDYDEHMKGSSYLLTGRMIFELWENQRELGIN